MDVINELIMQAISSPWLYLVLFAATIIDGFFPPIPSETLLVAAAAASVSSGGGELLLLGAVAAVAATIGDNIAFLVGRRVGVDRFAWMRRPRVRTIFAAASSSLDRRPAALILGARYIPVGRVMVNMSAGALQFPWRRFLPLSLVAGASWSVFSLAIGLLAGSWLRGQPLLSAALGIAVALLVGFVIDRAVAARRARAGRHEDGDLSASSTGSVAVLLCGVPEPEARDDRDDHQQEREQEHDAERVDASAEARHRETRERDRDSGAGRVGNRQR